MAILSKKVLREVGRSCREACGLQPYLVGLAGAPRDPADELAALAGSRRRRDYALQESLNLGEGYVFQPVPGVASWLVALEHRRIIHGGLVGGEVLLQDVPAAREEAGAYLAAHGFAPERAAAFLARLPVWPEARAREAADFLHRAFYEISGWQPDLMRENRLRARQRAQISQAIEDRRGRGGADALYAFEKERVLLANIRAGDRPGARSILNDMLATIYMSSPELVVLRARTVELMSCLTRAAIEDNPLLEPLILRNHGWTERLVNAGSFEELSRVLMAALDEFIDGIYLQGANRSHARLTRALDYISRHSAGRLTLGAIAREAGLSPCRLSHVVRQHTGRTVLQIVHEARVRHAQRLLESTALSGAQIAYDVGFSDQSYFVKIFRRLTGTTPARYRRARGPSARGHRGPRP